MSKHNVNGSWLGNFYYSSIAQPFGFEAVFMEVNGSIEGSILDDGNLGEAFIFGTFSDPNLSFTKKYRNSGLHAVVYEGSLSDEGKKLTGTWRIGSSANGSWVAWRQEEEEIPDLDRETEDDNFFEEEMEQEKVRIRPMTQPRRQSQR